MNKTAVLLSGRLGSWRNSLPTLLQNLAVPSNADIFIVTSITNTLRKTPAGPYVSSYDREAWHEKSKGMVREDVEVSRDEMLLLTEVLGDNLKNLSFVEDLSEGNKVDLACLRARMARAIADYQEESIALGIPPPCSGHAVPPEDPGIGYVVDQYFRVRIAYELMQEYEFVRGQQYDYVMRARPDFIVEYPWDIRTQALDPSVVYVVGSARGSVNHEEMEWADDFCWFSSRYVARSLFPQLHRMGLITNRRYNTFNKTQGLDYVFSPETQFSLLLHELDLPVQAVPLYRMGRYTPGDDGWDYHNYLFGKL